jgi:hypothetical protein
MREPEHDAHPVLADAFSFRSGVTTRRRGFSRLA